LNRSHRDGFFAAGKKIKMERDGVYVTFLGENSSNSGRNP